MCISPKINLKNNLGTGIKNKTPLLILETIFVKSKFDNGVGATPL